MAEPLDPRGMANVEHSCNVETRRELCGYWEGDKIVMPAWPHTLHPSPAEVVLLHPSTPS